MQDLSYLLTQLEHPDPVRRERVLAELRGHGEEALPLLRRALHVGLGATRPAAAEALVGLGEPAVPFLREALQDAEREVRVWSVWCLKQIPGTAAAASLLAALDDPDPGVRKQVVEGLGQRPDSGVAAALCSVLRDSDATLRQRAAELLGERGEPSAVLALCEALQDQATGVRVAACTALGALGVELSAAALIERLGDPLTQVRKSAAAALGAIRAAGAAQPLCRLLESLDVGLRETAAEALAKIGERHSVTASYVAEVVFQADATRQELAGEILVRIGDASIPELCRLLTLTRSSTRLVAARALRALAERTPSARLRLAIPVLKTELSPLALHAEPTRDELRATLRVIEEATRQLRHLPIPAGAAAARARELPVPAASEEPAPAEGMTDSQVEAERNAEPNLGKRWVRRIRRLWSGR
jgi:HEAT repeat protein